jgi:hypothetical protein
MMDLDILPYDIGDRDEFWEGKFSSDHLGRNKLC